jgi:hypothetical protein
VQDVICFGGNAGPRRGITQAVKQIVSHEAMMEWVRRQERRDEVKRERGAAAALADGEDVEADGDTRDPAASPNAAADARGGGGGSGKDAAAAASTPNNSTAAGDAAAATPGSAASSSGGLAALSQVTPAAAAKRALTMAVRAAGENKKDSPSERGPVDFFGRPVKRLGGGGGVGGVGGGGGPVNIAKMRTQSSGPGNRHEVHLRWQEGLTNAVRRTVRMSDLV